MGGKDLKTPVETPSAAPQREGASPGASIFAPRHGALGVVLSLDEEVALWWACQCSLCLGEESADVLPAPSSQDSCVWGERQCHVLTTESLLAVGSFENSCSQRLFRSIVKAKEGTSSEE